MKQCWHNTCCNGAFNFFSNNNFSVTTNNITICCRLLKVLILWSHIDNIYMTDAQNSICVSDILTFLPIASGYIKYIY